MSLIDEYVAILTQISALEQPRQKGVGLPKDSATVAKKLIDLQARAQAIRDKLESSERMLRMRGESAESKRRLESELGTNEMIAKAALGEEEWNRRQRQLAIEFDREQQVSMANKRAKAEIDIGTAREKAALDRQRIEAEGLNEALAEETRQQVAIRRLGEIRKVASDTRILRMGPDSEPVKALVGELVKPELQVIGGAAVAQEILTKSQAVHQRATGNIKRVATKMFADRGYVDKVPADLEENISASLKTGGNVYQYTDKKLGELQTAEIEQKKAETVSAERSARYAELRKEYNPKIAETILGREYPGGEGATGLKPGTAEHTDLVRGLKRTGALKSFGVGAGSVLLAGLLAKKIFGSKEEPTSLPPEVQMALAAQVQQAQGGAEAGAKQTSRTLSDIGKLLSIMKVLQSVGGGEAQMPVSAGAIV